MRYIFTDRKDPDWVLYLGGALGVIALAYLLYIFVGV